MIRTLLRALVLPGLAGTLLAGCATGYEYRGGPGDYYYGQPEVQYRDQGWYGYGSYGDPYGGYGYPYGVYGYPYYYGGGYPYDPYWNPYWVRPPHHGHDHDHDRDDPPRPPTRQVPPPIQPTPPPRWRDRDDDVRPPRPVVPTGPGVMAPIPTRPVSTPRTFTPREPRESQERDTHRKTLP